MSLEGTIRDLGLHEVGQLLSLSRKSGVLVVASRLRGERAWIRLIDGAMVDAGRGDPLAPGEASEPARTGVRPAVEDAVLDVLAWREGHFSFHAESAGAGGASRVRIPTDAMLVESVRREDAWGQLRDRVPSADVIPSFVDVEPKTLPLLRLVPQEWEVLTRVDGQRNLRTLAHLLQREVLEVAGIVHRLVGTGLLTVREMGGLGRVTGSMPAVVPEGVSVAVPAAIPPATLPPPRVDGATLSEASVRESDELWIPATAELAAFELDEDPDDRIFDPQRAGLLTPHGTPRIRPEPQGPASAARTNEPASTTSVGTVTRPASRTVASGGDEPSSNGSPIEARTARPADARALRDAGDAAARRGDFETALSCWSQYLRSPGRADDADRVREAIGLAARLQALLHPAVST